VVVIDWILYAVVLAGAVPLATGCYQFALAGLHRFRRRDALADVFPHVAVIVPAWNEAAVIERTLEQLAALDYPHDALRVYVVDDASTDTTPEIVRAAGERHPGLVFHLRRARGGEGKAQTINYGLRHVAEDPWYEAILIIDADVILTSSALRRMARHLASADVGAVTAYIKEGSHPGNYLNRFIAYEYIAAQAAARRAQNVLGAHACLAGGAQLISRAALEAIGGMIDTTTLAEDTVTTFEIQLTGRRVVFEPHAVVWAEEPREVDALWKQRLRWGRGNLQITSRFRRIWFRRSAGNLGGVSFALIWFPILLMPVLMVIASFGLITLFFVDRDASAHVFRLLWLISVVTYVFSTGSCFSVDPGTARRVWREGLLFPGAVSLTVMLYAAAPALFTVYGARWLRDLGADPARIYLGTVLLLFSYLWISACMVAAFLLKRLAASHRVPWLVAPLVYLVGFGPILCGVTCSAYVMQFRGAAMTWEKTEKIGAIGKIA
jgi:glycosyltransferase involved in cell wall biosynthesis